MGSGTSDSKKDWKQREVSSMKKAEKQEYVREVVKKLSAVSQWTDNI